MKTFFSFFLLATATISYSQNPCLTNTSAIEQLVKKKYSKLPVDGAKYVYIDSCKYIIGVGTTTTTNKTTSVMATIASTKARREVILLLNNPYVSSETIIRTEQISTENNVSFKELFRDEIKVEASAFVSGMSELTTFVSDDASSFVYVLFKPIN